VFQSTTKLGMFIPRVFMNDTPLPGEEAMHQQFRALVAAADKEPRLKQLITEAATAAEEEVVKPLFQFRNYGLSLPHNWTTITNGAEFGTDYYTRTAVAKSNILVNKPNETRYFYQDLDATGQRLRGDRNYCVTFAKDQLPPVRGFWSLTLYNEDYIGATPPSADVKSNWLPAPTGEFSLYLRSYWPESAISEGRWTPPPVSRN
jgi:hypothetical protein